MTYAEQTGDATGPGPARLRPMSRRRAVLMVLEIAALALGVHLLIPQLAGLEATGELERTT